MKSLQVHTVVFFVFIVQSGISFGQSEARRYPRWVYEPQEKSGMVSAIAYAFGDTPYEAIENVEKKVIRQLYLHLSNTILVLTAEEAENFRIDSSMMQLRRELISLLSEETIQTGRREMYVGEEDSRYKAIMLMDTPIAGFTNLILKTVGITKFSPKSKKTIKKRVKNMQEFIKEASQMTKALH